MINWNKKPYTEEQFTTAWEKAVFADDAAKVLNVPISTGNLRALNRIAEELGMVARPVWNRDFSVEEFESAWKSSLTVKEVSTKLGAYNSRGMKELAKHLNLPEKSDTQGTTFTKESFIAAWENNEYLDEVANALDLSTSKQSLAKLIKIARTLELQPKKIKIHTTDTGEDASAIIADWIDWHTDHYKVSPLPTQIKIAAKHVKELITAKYVTQSIKYGLFQWTLAVHKGYMDPSIITSMTYQHHLQNNPEVAAVANQLETQNESPAVTTGRTPPTPPKIEAKQW